MNHDVSPSRLPQNAVREPVAHATGKDMPPSGLQTTRLHSTKTKIKTNP